MTPSKQSGRRGHGDPFQLGLVLFSNAPTWGECRQALDDYPELLSDKADRQLAYYIGQYALAGDTPAVCRLVQRRELLRACREQGLDATFSLLRSESAYPDLAHLPADVRQPVQELSTLEAQPQHMERRARLASRALARLARIEHPVLWATLQRYLGEALFEKPGRSAADEEQAIAACQKAAEVFAPDALPLEWAETQNFLGTVYWWRSNGDADDNLERAIQHYQAALRVYSPGAFPEEAAIIHSNLGLAYQRRQGSDPSANLELAIEHYTAALQVYTAEGYPFEWAAAQSSLGLAYRARLAGDPADNLERAIACYQAALQVYTPDQTPDQWAATQLNLGTALKLRNAADPDQAIACYMAALQVYSERDTPQEWAKAQLALGETYYHRNGDPAGEDLEQAIVALEAALRVYDPQTAPSDWGDAQNLLGLAYYRREQGDRADNLERAIAAYRAALQVATRAADPQEWAILQANLGTALLSRASSGDAGQAGEARTCFEASLEIFDRRTSPKEWAIAQAGLANALIYLRADPVQDVEMALACARQALDVYTQQDFPNEWAAAQQTLGDAYSVRIMDDRSANLERAIEHYQAALEVRTRAEHPNEWAVTESNLGTAYVRRLRGLSADNIELAIQHLESALEVLTAEAAPDQWANTRNSLGAAFRYRGYGQWADNVERAIAHYQAALQVRTRERSPDQWAAMLNNLADAYRVRRRGESADNMERAIECGEQALQVRTRQGRPAEWAETQTNLALAYAGRIQGDKEQNLARAEACYRLALEVYTPQYWPDRARSTALDLGSLLLQMGRWEESWQALGIALQAGSNLYRAALSESGRQAELDVNATAAADAAYCLARLGRVREAVELLESARTRSLGEAMALDAAELDSADAVDRARLRAARETLRRLNGESQLPLGTPQRRTEEELAEALRQAYADLDAAIARIQAQQPGFALPGPRVEEMAALAEAGAALALPAVSTVGTAIFILAGGSPESWRVIWAPGLTRESLRTWLVRRDAKGEVQGGYLVDYTGGNPAAWKAAIENLGRWLWEQLMESLHRQLQAMNVRRVILVPQGMLHLLPLHAACYETTPGQARFFLNEYEVGYAPSGGVLARCQARRAGDRAGQAAEPFVAVADPTGDLPFAGLEVDAIRRLLARPPVVLGGPERGAGQLAASGAVLAALGSARIFHFAGHGAYNWQDPLDSALLCCGKSPGHGRGSDPVAASDPLTLRSLLNGPSPERLRLVVLSACETGLTDIGQAADEYIGLPAGFLQAGAPAVVSSLWAVDDLSTALLMEEFYRRHLGEGQGIAQALRGAQLWLRDLKRDDLLSRVAAAREEARTHPDRRLWARLDALREALSEDYGPEDRPFAHPYYWAAFIASGAV